MAMFAGRQSAGFEPQSAEPVHTFFQFIQTFTTLLP
jgi:hypothetical protein